MQVQLREKRVQPTDFRTHWCWKQNSWANGNRWQSPIFAREHFCHGLLVPLARNLDGIRVYRRRPALVLSNGSRETVTTLGPRRSGHQGATINLVRMHVLNRAVAEKSSVAPAAFAFGS